MPELFPQPGTASPEEMILALHQQQRDFTGLARTYYQLGVLAMEQGELGKAMLWLCRADTIYSASDEIYDAMGKELMDDCSRRIGELEDAPLLTNEVSAQVMEKAEEMDDAQVRVWSLLSLARLVPLGKKLAALPGCDVLGTLDTCIDLVVKSFQEPITQEEFDTLKEACNGLYQLVGAEPFIDGKAVECAAGAPFQVFDLNGQQTLLCIDLFLDEHMDTLAGEPTADDGSLISCTLLADYYRRTRGGDIREIPQVKAEVARIWDDYEFICAGPTWNEVIQRIEGYKTLDIFQE